MPDNIQDSEEQVLIPKSSTPSRNPLAKLKQKLLGSRKRTFTVAEKARITSRARREPLDDLFEEYYERKPSSDGEYQAWVNDIEKWCMQVDANAKRAFVSPIRNFIHKAGAAILGFGSGVGAGITISAFIFCAATGISFSIAATPLVVLVPAGLTIGCIGALVAFYGAGMIKNVANKVGDYRAAQKLEKVEREYAETHGRSPAPSCAEITQLLKQANQQIQSQEQHIQQVKEAAESGARRAVEETIGKLFYSGSANRHSIGLGQIIQGAKIEQQLDTAAKNEQPENAIG